MISNILRSDIDRYADEFRRTSRLFGAAKAGRVTPSIVVRYLTSLRYLLGRTPPHLVLARRRAEELGNDRLAAYFAEKVGEEIGHDEWAREDAERIANVFGTDAPDSPANAIEALVKFTRETIERDPLSYLAYILFTEYFTVSVGPEWVQALVEKCGIPASSLTVVSRHVELDVDHTADGCREIDALVDEDSLESLRAMLRDTASYFSSFCDELCPAAA